MTLAMMMWLLKVTESVSSGCIVFALAVPMTSFLRELVSSACCCLIALNTGTDTPSKRKVRIYRTTRASQGTVLISPVPSP